MKLKVLHILYSGLGGHGNVFFSMTDADKEREFQYEVLFYGIEKVRENYIEKAKARNIPWYFVKKKPGLDFSSYSRIRTIIKESAPDIIFSHSSSYIYPLKRAAMAASKKITIIVRETQPNHLKTIPQWLGLSVALFLADKVVFLSTEYRDAIKKKLFFLFSNKRTAVIPNGIDLELYFPQQSKSEDFIRIGMQSRLSLTKDHATLIKAFSLCIKKNVTGKKLLLCIAGDGDCKPSLEALAKDLAIEANIVFTGMLEETDLPNFINSLDIYVHATLGETMSTAIMQVMACQLPIVASDVLGVNNMINDKVNGLLVPALNENELAEAILFLLNNPDIAANFARAAYKFAVNNYSNKVMLERYKMVFAK